MTEAKSMEDWLIPATKYAVMAIDGMALIILFAGCAQAFINGLRVMLSSAATNHQRREVWLQFSRWLIAGLSFQLAADILETSIAPSWEEIAKLGAIAVIRTFLNYFLERDIEETRERDRKAMERARENFAKKVNGTENSETLIKTHNESGI